MTKPTTLARAKKRLQRCDMFAPVKCRVCTVQIEKLSTYYAGRVGYEWCETCYIDLVHAARDDRGSGSEGDY